MAAKKIIQSKLNRFFPWLLIVAGVLGLFASFTLTMEKFALLENPNHQLSCDINPIVACGSVIATPQASAFSFPNPFIGLAAFAALIIVGVTLLTGVKIDKRWYWRTFLAGTLFGVMFVHWLAFQSIYRIEALCPYCMVVWVVTISTFWYSLVWMLRQGYVSLPKGWGKMNDFIQRNHLGILISWFLVIIGLILNHFWYFFGF